MSTPPRRRKEDRGSGHQGQSIFTSKPLGGALGGLPTSELYQQLVEKSSSVQKAPAPQQPSLPTPPDAGSPSPLSAVLEYHRQQNKLAEEARLNAKAGASKGGKGGGSKGGKGGKKGSQKPPTPTEPETPKRRKVESAPAPAAPEIEKKPVPASASSLEAYLTHLKGKSQPPVYISIHTNGWHSDEAAGDALAAKGRWPAGSDIVLKVKSEKFGDFEGVLQGNAVALCALLSDEGWEKFVYGVQNLLTALISHVGDTEKPPARCYDMKTMLWMLNPCNVPSLRDALLEYRQTSVFSLNTALKLRLQDERLAYGFTHLETPLSWLLAKMRVNGFPINIEVIRESTEQNTSKLHELEAEAASLAEMEGFNIQSHDDIRAVLFDRLKLHEKVGCHNLNFTPKKGVYSTDKDTMTVLAAHHQLPAVILEHRALQKIQSTYVQNLTQHAMKHPTHKVFCVHPIFNQEGTDTGRLSCSSPNLQNQPRKGNPHGKIREAFEPLPGEVLIALDYSQIEVRVLAHVSRDPGLIAVLSKGGDMHTSIAAKVFHKREEDVTSDERQAGKKVVFGMIYGQGVKALAGGLGVSVDRAAGLLSGFKREFPVAVAWGEKVVAQCRSTGVVRTFANRLRRLPNITSANSFERSHAERQAVNTIIQGSAADIIKMAMITTHTHAPRYNLTLLCQVHDEVIYSCPSQHVAEVIPLLKDAMENATSLCVPLKVTVEYGPTWGGLKPWVG